MFEPPEVKQGSLAEDLRLERKADEMINAALRDYVGRLLSSELVREIKAKVLFILCSIYGERGVKERGLEVSVDENCGAIACAVTSQDVRDSE